MRSVLFAMAVVSLAGLCSCAGETRSTPHDAGAVDGANGVIPDAAGEGGLDAAMADASSDTTTAIPSTLWRQAMSCAGCYPYDVATDSQGGVFVGGLATGPISDFGDGQAHDASWDGFLVRYHPDGTVDWVKVFRGEVTNRLTKLLVGPDDRVVAVGRMQGDTDLGAGVIPVHGPTAFLAKYELDGALSWVRVVDPQTIPGMASAAMDGEGGLVAVGSFHDPLDCYGLASSATRGSYVLKLDAGGAPVSCRVIAEEQGFIARLVEVSSDGATWVAGRCAGGTDLGGGPLAQGTNGGPCVLKLDAAGEYSWSWIGVAVDAPQWPLAMSVDEEGNAFLSGLFQDTLAVGSTVLESLDISYLGVYAIKLDVQGKAVWARSIASRSSFEPGDGPEPSRCDVASDGYGGAVFAGTFYEVDADFGGEVLPAEPYATVYAGRLDADGGHVWSHAYGGAGRQQGSAVAMRPDGSIALAGYFTGAIELDPSLQGTGEGYEDGFVATLAAE